MACREPYRGRRFQTGYELACLVANWDGVTAAALEVVRGGLNTSCVDCGDRPMDGGLRCQPCFTTVVLKRRKAAA
jgi:hypothetical protein